MTLSKTIVHGESRWCLTTFSSGGKRKRQFFKNEAEARKAASDARKHFAAVGKAFEVLPATEKAQVLGIVQEIKDAGYTLPLVWQTFKSIPHAPKASRTLQQAFDEFIASRRQANCRKKTLHNYEWYVGKFVQGRSAQGVSGITAHDIEKWFAERSESPEAQKTNRRLLSAFFNYCLAKKYIGENPILSLPPIQLDRHAPAVLTLRQSWKALCWTRKHAPSFLSWIVKTLLLGLRPDSEADHAPIIQADLDRKRFVVNRSKVRGVVPRVLDLDFCPPALEWLRLAKKLSGDKPLSHSVRRKYLRRLRDYLGFKEWPQDVLRHTAASNLLAYHQDAGRVASFLGNSPGVLLRDYKALVYKEDAERFMGMMPDRGEKRSRARKLNLSKPVAGVKIRGVTLQSAELSSN